MNNEVIEKLERVIKCHASTNNEKQIAREKIKSLRKQIKIKDLAKWCKLKKNILNRLEYVDFFEFVYKVKKEVIEPDLSFFVINNILHDELNLESGDNKYCVVGDVYYYGALVLEDLVFLMKSGYWERNYPKAKGNFKKYPRYTDEIHLCINDMMELIFIETKVRPIKKLCKIS